MTASPPATGVPESEDALIQVIANVLAQKSLQSMEFGDDGTAPIDVDDQERRTQSLASVLPGLSHLWQQGENGIVNAAEKLADGCRDPLWRIPMGDAGILDFFLDVLTVPGISQILMIQILRFIGNSCADTDENRKRVVSRTLIPSIVALIQNSSLIPFAIPVLFNICVDYEPAQKQASEAMLSARLTELLLGPNFEPQRAFLGYICKIFALLISQPTEVELAPEDTPNILMRMAARRQGQVDLEDYLSLINAATSYLEHERFQEPMVEHSKLDMPLRLLVDSYMRFGDVEDEDDIKLLATARSSLNQALSDISALPSFSAAYPVVSPFTSQLRQWLSRPQTQLQVCACIMLGNIARSDAACVEFVHVSAVHKPLIAILSTTSDSQILHAVLGFLKNLALPAANKNALGEAGILEVLPRLWALDALQQIQYGAVSLTRQLIVGNFDNIRRIARPLSSDPDSPAHTRTCLSILIALFERTDVEPTKMEIARLITAICRFYNTHLDTQDELASFRRKKFFARHPDVAVPLSFMVTQKKWPVVRSEGWFVFALMARTEEGAGCVSDMMHEPSVLAVLVEVLTGQSVQSPQSPGSGSASAGLSPAEGMQKLLSQGETVGQAPGGEKEAEMKRVDRENALVLVSELLKTKGEEMATLRKTMFEDLLQGGGTVHLSYKQIAEGAAAEGA